MKLVGKLKESVEQVSSKEEANKLIEDAGMKLNDDELDAVVGGIDLFSTDNKETQTCDKCMFGWSNCKVNGNEKCPENKTIVPKKGLRACNKYRPRPF